MDQSREFVRSKSTQVAELIHRRIEEGSWGGELPAERLLAAEFFVSRSCLRSALDLLATEGVIGPPRQSRPREILLMQPKVRVEARQRTGRPTEVHLATSVSDLTSSPRLLFQLATLRRHFAAAQMTVRQVTLPRSQGVEDPGPSLRRMVSAARGGVWILHLASQKVQEWFDQQETACLVFGSTFPGVHLPSVDIDFRGVTRHAAGRLLGLGHREIAVIVSRSILAGDEMVLAGLHEALESHEEPTPEPRVLRHDFNVGRLTASLDRVFERKEGMHQREPTALIVHNEHHLLTAVTHLLSRGIRIPEDLSVVSLVNDSALERLSPQIDRYDVGERLVEALAKGVVRLLADGSRVNRLILPEVVEGRSVRSIVAS